MKLSKITDTEWKEAISDGKKAKELLGQLTFKNGSTLSFLEFGDGKQIPVSDVSEEQAKNFFFELAPTRIWRGVKQ